MAFSWLAGWVWVFCCFFFQYGERGPDGFLFYVFCIRLDLYHWSVCLLTQFNHILMSHSYFSLAYMKDERFKQYEKANVMQTYVASMG